MSNLSIISRTIVVLSHALMSPKPWLFYTYSLWHHLPYYCCIVILIFFKSTFMIVYLIFIYHTGVFTLALLDMLYGIVVEPCDWYIYASRYHTAFSLVPICHVIFPKDISWQARKSKMQEVPLFLLYQLVRKKNR